jgi:hypothetical protein
VYLSQSSKPVWNILLFSTTEKFARIISSVKLSLEPDPDLKIKKQSSFKRYRTNRDFYTLVHEFVSIILSLKKIIFNFRFRFFFLLHADPSTYLAVPEDRGEGGEREERKMAVLGIQFVITMMMATVLSRVGPHVSLARWLLASK